MITYRYFLFVLILLPKLASAADRKANFLEFAYSHLAPGLNVPELCEKISPRAYLSAGLSSAGNQISYTRSDCYSRIAMVTGDPKYCTFVKEKRHWFLSGKNVAADACRARVQQGSRYLSGGGDNDVIARFLGYSERDLDNTQAEQVRDLIYEQSLQSELRQKSASLPDFTLSGAIVSPDFISKIGCVGERSKEHYCLVGNCLLIENEVAREKCLDANLGV